jgi:1,4-alpha-glucan branching enzyme
MLQVGRSRIRVQMRSLDSFFNLPNPFSRTMGPGDDSASDRNEYQEYSWNILGGKVRPAGRADKLTAIYEPIV